MTSAALGDNTSGLEVAKISEHGFWLVVGRERLFLSFDRFPWFRNAPFDKVRNVEQPGLQHLYWPDLDIDLSMESIRHPEKFPLVSRATS